LLKVPGVVGLAATGAALKVVGPALDFSPSFAVEVPFPPLPNFHRLPLGCFRDSINANSCKGLHLKASDRSACGSMLEIGCGGFRVTLWEYHRVDVDAARVDRTR
jgi:hypothetical protein